MLCPTGTADWQSVYPYLQDGTLAPVMAHKAAHSDKSAEEYRAYYETGYKTDVDRIVIGDGQVTFHRGEDSVSGQYETDGYEILTYTKGNRGVRFIFRKTGGDDGTPGFIQFSDHRIAPAERRSLSSLLGQRPRRPSGTSDQLADYFPASLTAENTRGGNDRS
ncbi:UNVERIFIED_CONTAM: hypothetical protein GTU68_029022 [Idotea baltica]|nr:hypothetical protein [Idotea baltica]